MADHIRQTIVDLQQTVRNKELEIVGIKKTVNLLLQQIGDAALYAEAELNPSGATPDAIRPDTFYGQPLSGSVRKILEMRKRSGAGPASVREIYDALIRGGFQFGTDVEDNAIRSLRISLTKSSHTFHRLPNGSYGLTDWYPEIREQRVRNRVAEYADTDAEENGPEIAGEQ